MTDTEQLKDAEHPQSPLEAPLPTSATSAEHPNSPEDSISSPTARIPSAAQAVTSTSPSTNPFIAATTNTPMDPPEIPHNRPDMQQEVPVDPKLAVLRAMFPDFDDAVLVSVLESSSGDTDRAIDTLLGMSDPEYRSEMRPQEPVLSQTELDERLARQLYLEDEQQRQQQQSAWQAQTPGGQAWQRPPNGRRASQIEPERDTMAEIGESFNKIAETGKRTFGNIFNKVRAKMAELDQQRQDNRPSGSTWGGVGGDTYPYEPGTAPFPTPGSDATQHQQAAYQQPAPASNSQATPPSSTPAESSSIRGYDIGPPTENETPRPPTTSSGSGIDAGKLGLLPKRPVSLLRPQSPSSHPVDGAPGHPTRISTARQDSDDLDYVENPFNDERK